MRSSIRRIRYGFFALALACGGDASSDGETRAVPAEGATAGAPGERTGAFDLGGTSYPFRVTQCDLAGERPDGVVLRGAGTAPDGRRLSVVVSRTATRSGDVVWENATLYFGSIVDGDHWTARRGGQADGRWVPGNPGDPADGPLIQVSGSDLLVEGTMHHETEETSRLGVLRATCG